MSFKCCRNKESSVYFCIACYSTMHRSCSKNYKHVIAVKDNLIICSPNCLDSATEREPDTFNILLAQIKELKQESCEKDTHIERLKRNSRSFMEDATQNEEQYIQELADYRQKVKSLENLISQQKCYQLDRRELVTQALQIIPPTKEISCQSSTLVFKSNHTQTDMCNDLNQQINSMEVELQDRVTEIQQLLKDLEEVSTLNQSYKVSISTIEAENNLLQKELVELKKELEEMKEERGQMMVSLETLEQENMMLRRSTQKEISFKVGDPTCKITKVKGLPKKINGTSHIMNILVVLSDDLGKYMYDPINKLLGDKYSICLVTKPFARIKDIVKNSDCYIRELRSDDYVILLAGLNNTDLSIHDITLLSNKCFKTNLIICNIPCKLKNNNIVDEKCINVANVNEKLSSITTKLKMFCINIDFVTTDNLKYSDFYYNSNFYMNKRGLCKLANNIKIVIGNFGKHNSTNLKYVPTQDIEPFLVGVGTQNVVT